MQRVDVLRQRKRARHGRDPRGAVQPVQPQVPEPRGARRVRKGAGCARRGRPAHVRRAAGQGRGAVRGGHRAARARAGETCATASSRTPRTTRPRPRRGRHGTPRGLRRGVLRGVCGPRAVQHVGVLPLRGGVRRRRGLPVQAPRVLVNADGAAAVAQNPVPAWERGNDGIRWTSGVVNRTRCSAAERGEPAPVATPAVVPTPTGWCRVVVVPALRSKRRTDARAGPTAANPRRKCPSCASACARPGGEPRRRRRARVLRRRLRHERSTVLLRRGRPRRARTAGLPRALLVRDALIRHPRRAWRGRRPQPPVARAHAVPSGNRRPPPPRGPMRCRRTRRPVRKRACAATAGRADRPTAQIASASPSPSHRWRQKQDERRRRRRRRMRRIRRRRARDHRRRARHWHRTLRRRARHRRARRLRARARRLEPAAGEGPAAAEPETTAADARAHHRRARRRPAAEPATAEPTAAEPVEFSTAEPTAAEPTTGAEPSASEPATAKPTASRSPRWPPVLLRRARVRRHRWRRAPGWPPLAPSPTPSTWRRALRLHWRRCPPPPHGAVAAASGFASGPWRSPSRWWRRIRASRDSTSSPESAARCSERPPTRR